jgi:Ca2+-transporting ATPase
LQVLWINFAVDVPLAIGLGFDAPTSGLMKRLPRKANASVLPRPLAIRLIGAGLVMAIVVLAVVKYGEDQYNLGIALTMGVTTLSLCHVVGAITTRDPERSALSLYTFANRRFTYMIGLTVGLTVLVSELDFMQRIFDTVSLTRDQWLICLLGTGILLAVYEVAKLILGKTGWLSITAAQSADVGLVSVSPSTEGAVA